MAGHSDVVVFKKTLQAEELATILKEGNEKVTIIDVRDEDFELGHIKGAINAPSEKLKTDDVFVDSIIDEHCKNGNKVIFHCMLSQKRGPTCANVVAARLQARNMSDEHIHVLTGGYKTFAGKYLLEDGLIEKDQQ